ncbi:uncharacterized protein LOC123528247 [Mercenaria mercenaria]|uniref:uncharacterized protein LOC123528247 n=1 Tax=Mercenaria mercenaria TaxID=6596 RepID=UPI00234E4AF0|nr:uncharacterized protein LOC123528247 [Mercenaria mercenaria]XP_045163911.2 uncharacterized protein LOC123528247 [Mercenaria mercenaria]
MRVTELLAGNFFFFVLLVARALCAAPTGCTAIDGLYECDYGTVSLPMAETSFSSPLAQRVRLTNVNGNINTDVFGTTFASIDTTQFDTNWAPTFEIKCDGSVTLGQNTFSNMDHIRDVKIVNCDVTVPANTFLNLMYLDRLVIENGTITSWDAAAMDGMQIVKFTDPSPAYPVKTGELIFMNSKLTSQSFPTGAFTKQGRIETLVLEGLDLNTLEASMFSNNTKLRILSLGYNSFTTLPSGLFDNLDSLAELHLYDTQLDCNCTNLWFFEHADTTKMKIRGDMTCATPADWAYYRAASYYQSNCVTTTESCSKGLELMGACITYFELAMYIVCVWAFILAIIVLILVIHTKRQMGGGSSSSRKKGGPRSKKPDAGKKRPPKETKKGWA